MKDAVNACPIVLSTLVYKNYGLIVLGETKQMLIFHRTQRDHTPTNWNAGHKLASRGGHFDGEEGDGIGHAAAGDIM